MTPVLLTPENMRLQLTILNAQNLMKRSTHLCQLHNSFALKKIRYFIDVITVLLHLNFGESGILCNLIVFFAGVT